MISPLTTAWLRISRLFVVAPVLLSAPGASAAEAARAPRLAAPNNSRARVAAPVRPTGAVPGGEAERNGPPPSTSPVAAAQRDAEPTPSPPTTPAPGPTDRATPPGGPPATDVDPREARIRALEETLARLQERLDQPDKDERIRALEATVVALEQRLKALAPPEETAPGLAAPVPPDDAGPNLASPGVPEPAPDETAPGEPAPPARVGATLLPNISGIGNVIFRGGSRGTENRGRFNTQEVELAFQDRVAPNLRADFFLSAEKEADWTTEVEEAYLTWTNPLGLARLSARLGKVRTPFGKLNPLHPHQWRFVDQPAVISAFLGPDGLNSDGALLQYLLPLPGLFANLEIGGWQTRSEAEDGRGFAGAGRDAFSARLWLSRALGRERELELGFSRYQGRGTPEGLEDSRRLAINGVDLTYRAYPGGDRRFMLQGEAIQHHTSGPGRDRSRWGGYLDLAYRPTRYYEGGLRGDSTRLPFPQEGQESAISAYVTRFLTEQTSMRLQVRHGSRPEKSGFTEIFLQFLFGFGPHSHLLQ
jgi:hypothetical protein